MQGAEFYGRVKGGSGGELGCSGMLCVFADATAGLPAALASACSIACKPCPGRQSGCWTVQYSSLNSLQPEVQGQVHNACPPIGCTLITTSSAHK